MDKCVACGKQDVKSFYHIDNLPLLLFPVDKDIRYDIKQERIEVFICQDCSHIFSEPVSKENEQLIYGKYYKYYPYDDLESMNIYYRSPFESFFNKVVKPSPKDSCSILLEIGCSSGEQLKFFESYSYQCFGIDPSPLNEDSSGNIISGFYQDYSFERQFDVIVARFVLEHVNFLDDFLSKIYKDLKDEGLTFIQVPNVMEFISNFIPSFLAHEHPQYFNRNSLISLAERNSFEIVDLLSEGSQSICIALRKVNVIKTTKVKELEHYSEKINLFSFRRNQFAGEVLNFLSQSNEICFYGAGLMLTWLFYDLEYLKIKSQGLILDNNKLLDGKYLPQSNFIVRTYKIDLIRNFNIVLLTLNPVYHNTIVDLLINDGYEGQIYGLSKNGIQNLSELRII